MEIVELYHQYYDIVRQMPESSAIRTVKKNVLNDFVTTEVMRMSTISTRSNYESRNWPRPCCNPNIEVVNYKKRDDEVINMLENVVLAQGGSPTSCCYSCQLSNVIYTQTSCWDLELSNTSAWAYACCPCICCSCILCCCNNTAGGFGLFFGIMGCLACCFLADNPEVLCERQRIDSIEEAKSVMRTLRMMETEIPMTCKCCCPLKADTQLVIQALRFKLLARIERIMHNMLEDHHLTAEELADFILSCKYGQDADKKVKENAYEKQQLIQELSKFKANAVTENEAAIGMHNSEFKLLNIQSRLYKDKISVILAKEMLKMGDKKVFAKMPFRDSFVKSNLRGNAADILMSNYHLLGGVNHSLTPARLAFLDQFVLKEFALLSHSSRIKEVGSFEAHKPDDEMFDLFGMKYVVAADSVFDCLARAYSVAEKVAKHEDVHGLAVQFKQKKTSYLDFKIITVLKGEQLSICEVQIIYSSIFTVDSIVGGHDIHKKNAELEEIFEDIDIVNPIVLTQQPK